MNARPPVIDKNDESEQETWYSKPLNEQCELSKKHQATLNKYFQAEGLPEDTAAYLCEVDGSPTLYLTPPTQSLAMSIGATPCEVPKNKRLSPYRNARDNLEIRA
jgi:hypothetical protein